MRIQPARFGGLMIAATLAMAAHGQTRPLECRDATGRVTFTDLGCDSSVDVREVRAPGYGGETGVARDDTRPRPVSSPAADERADREQLQAMRQDFRRSVNRARNKAAEAGIPGFR